MYMYNTCIRRLSVMLLETFFLFVDFIYDKVCDPVYINVTMVNQSRRRQTALFSILKEIAGLNCNC